MADATAFLPPPVPEAYHGLWQRTHLERNVASTLTSERAERVFWLQTAHWHADLRIPVVRPDFGGVPSINACDDAQLAFIAGQDAFCGITKVEGAICTWLRFHDMRPGTALDVGRMAFRSSDFIVETGVGEDYLEHWARVKGSEGETWVSHEASGAFVLHAGRFAMRVRPRDQAPASIDAYAFSKDAPGAHRHWLASLEISLLEDETVILSTHPWVEDRTLDPSLEFAACA